MKLVYIAVTFMVFYTICLTIIFHDLSSNLADKDTVAVQTNINKSHRSNSRKVGVVHGYISKQEWNQIYDSRIEGFFTHPLFPCHPMSESLISGVSQICSGINKGIRVHGWITPYLTGYYRFGMFSKHHALFLIYLPIINLKHNNKENHAHFLTELELPNNQSTQLSSSNVHLQRNLKYFFQIFYLQQSSDCSFSLLIKSPVDFTYSEIERRLLSARETDDSSYVICKAGKKPSENFTVKYDFLNLSLQSCDINISYINKELLKKYDGVNQEYLKEIWTEIYPRDASWDLVEVCDDSKPIGYCAGNSVLAEEDAFRIIETFMMSALEKFDGDCEIQKIVRIERHKDKSRGASRIFLELILRQSSKNTDFAMASYFFERYPRDLCNAFRYEWNPRAIVNIIVTVNNQTPWLKYLLASIKKISLATNDHSLRVVVADFNSSEKEIEKILLESGLPRYQFVSLMPPFVKFKGIQAGLDLIQEDGIALLMDLHMEIPLDFFDLIRKHCIKGRMAFNPVVMRLAPGHYPSNPAGFWELMGFGVIAMYKKDWVKIRRLDDIATKESWGGEDWQIVDYITMAGIEISRYRVPGFFHYYHTHENLWDGSSFIDKDFKMPN